MNRAALVLGALLALFVLALLGPAAAWAGPPPVSQRTLANGLRVVVVEDHAAAVAQTAMWYRFGSLDETAGKTGLAHALEHMMFRGTRAIPDGGIDAIAAQLGASVNAETTEDYTHFDTLLPAQNVDVAIHLEADRMRGLLLRGDAWALERGAVLAEYDGDVSRPLFRLAGAVRAALYEGTPYARDALGARNDVATAHTADLRAYYDRYYRPANAVLVVTGDVRPDRVFASARRWFGPLRGNAPPARPAAPVHGPACDAQPAVVTVGGSAARAVDLAYRIPGDLERDAAATQLFEYVVNSERSPFYRALVPTGRVLSYDAYADTALHQGIFHVVLFLAADADRAAAQRAFEAALASVRERGVEPKLLQAAKRAYLRDASFAHDAIGDLGEYYGYAYAMMRHDPRRDERDIAAMDAPTMNRAVATYFSAPQVVGVLEDHAQTDPGSGPGSESAPTHEASGKISDSFAPRRSGAPPVLAEWARAALHAPVRRVSRVRPQAYTLPNGLRLYVQRVAANPTVFISGNVMLSPAFDPPGREGLGALASTLAGYGSARYDFDAQRRVADALAADVQFGTAFSAHAPAAAFAALLDLLADSVERPAFAAPALTRVRDRELASLAAASDSADDAAGRAFTALLYGPGDPALRRETPASVRRVDARALRGYAARYFRPDRTYLIVAGDVDPAAVRTAVRRAFGGWRNAGPQPLVPQHTMPAPRAAVRFVRAETAVVRVRMGQRAPGRASPDFAAYELLEAVLGAGSGFDTRLMHELRDRRGIVYSIGSSLAAQRSRGVLEIDFSAAPDRAAAAVALVRAEVRRLTREPIPAPELARAKQRVSTAGIVSEESTQAIVARLETIAQHRLAPHYYATAGRRYDALDPRALLAVARRYLRPDDFAVVYEGPAAMTARDPARRRTNSAWWTSCSASSMRMRNEPPDASSAATSSGGSATAASSRCCGRTRMHPG